MSDIKFSCKDCVFAQYTSFKGKDIQYGCVLNRLQTLNPEDSFQEEDNVSYATFNRFCNARRPIAWMQQYCDDDLSVAQKEVMEEIKPRLSFIIKFNYNVDFFKQIADSLRNQISSRKFVIIINDKPEYNLELFEILEELYKEEKIVQYSILMPPSNLQYIYDSIDEAIMFCKNGWIVFLDEGKNIPPDFTEKIHNRINIELKRFVYCDSKKDKSFIIQASLYKLIGGNSPKVNGDGSIDKKSFLDRVSELKAEDPDCLVSWENIFNE